MANSWDATRDVLLTKKNHLGITTISQYDYTVNPLGQRIAASQTGTAFVASRAIAWGYDNLGQVVKADSNVNTDDRAYQYDGIGNRLKSADSLTLPLDNNYSPNVLNQYSSLTVGASGPLAPVYDLDGNMTSGPLPANTTAHSTLAWDAENRLISTIVNGVTTTYQYDSQSRRISKSTNGSASALYVYDGWNPIAEYSSPNLQSPISHVRSYLWGLDLSGSMQGAGGVGGLLAVKIGSNTFYPTFDGNGNVSEYLDSSGAIAAHYEYDPFGKETVSNGTKASDFAHRFSTKLLDSATGLYYYGYRYYDPTSGRWPYRDPIEEKGGLNLYGFVGNDGINRLDYLGLWFVDGLKFDRRNIDGAGGTIYVNKGKYYKFLDERALKSIPAAITAAKNHEDRHIAAAKASDDSHAIPYRQVFCINPDGVRKWYFYTREGGTLARKEFTNSMSLEWDFDVRIQYSTYKERNAEERKELAAEIKELEAVDGSSFVKRRISITLKPLLEYYTSGYGSNENGNTQNWESFKKVYEEEKKKAENGKYNFSWSKIETIYNELK